MRDPDVRSGLHKLGFTLYGKPIQQLQPESQPAAKSKE